ncbi:hypothetical protein [Flaviflexus equikiangi]|uniref:Uncharacterized protein n=1 Tax=Flaviflexus equikiangi TaxID=2758573 RepID=A0ABS2TE10_9ACTO|nr:hypothetical protein [Flaviflexus equikiangi]MBM9432328.1 hypothetical protein [Flaviflexus equikiangi]
MTPEIQVLLGLITVAGVIIGAVITGRYAERKARLETEASPYEALAERVTKLEQRTAVLEAEQEKDRAYIRRAVPWIALHADLALSPPPVPPDWWTDH